MAHTDPSDNVGGVANQSWTFREWLSGVRSWFSGSQKFIVSGGGMSMGSGVPPTLAIVAKARLGDRMGSGIRSRMEEAKQKNMMWENDLEPLVWQRLKLMFHPDNFDRMRLMASVSSNQMRRIVEDISILYENPAQRYIEEELDASEAKATKAKKDKPVIPNKDPKQADQTVPPTDPAAPSPKVPVPDAQNPAARKDPITGDPIPHPTGLLHQQPADPEQAALIGTGDPDIDALAALLELDGGEQDENNESPLAKVMELCDLDATLDLVEKYCRFHEAVWVRPYVSYKKVIAAEQNADGSTNKALASKDGSMEETPGLEDEGDPASATLEYIIYDPSNADVVEDPQNPSKMLAFYYWGEEILPNGKRRSVIHFFTDTDYWKFDSVEDWKILDHQPNKIGVIPVAVFRKEKPTPGSYYARGTGKDLFEGTLELCILKTIRNARFRDSGFKQIAVTNADEDQVDADVVMGGPHPVFLPDGATAQVLDLQPALQQMSDMVEMTQLELSARYGISAAEQKADGIPQSGFAKRLDRDKVVKENKRIRKFFTEGEKALYKVLALTLKQSPVKDIPELDPEACMVTDYAEPNFVEEPAKQGAQDAQDMEMHKTNIIEILARENPDLNEVDLVRKAYKNKRINEAFTPPETVKLIDLLATDAAATGGKSAGAPGAPGAPGGGGKPFGK